MQNVAFTDCLGPSDYFLIALEVVAYVSLIPKVRQPRYDVGFPRRGLNSPDAYRLLLLTTPFSRWQHWF